MAVLNFKLYSKHFYRFIHSVLHSIESGCKYYDRQEIIIETQTSMAHLDMAWCRVIMNTRTQNKLSKMKL